MTLHNGSEILVKPTQLGCQRLNVELFINATSHLSVYTFCKTNITVPFPSVNQAQFQLVYTDIHVRMLDLRMCNCFIFTNKKTAPSVGVTCVIDADVNHDSNGMFPI